MVEVKAGKKVSQMDWKLAARSDMEKTPWWDGRWVYYWVA